VTDRSIYEEAQEFAASLVTQGEPEAAGEINQAIEGGATSSEILFDLRWELDRLLERGAPADEDLRASAEALRDAIQSLLFPSEPQSD
jgi:hypothetical protein